MATNLGELIARAGIDVAGLQADAQKAGAVFDKLQQETGPKMLATGADMTGILTVPMVSIADASIGIYKELENSMNRVSALGGIYGKQLTDLTELAKDLGAKTVFSANDAAEAMGNLAAAGFSANEIMKASPGLMDLAAAGQLSMGEAATISANTLRTFRMEASEMGRVADVMALAASKANMSISDIGYTVKTVGPVAKASGMDIEELSAAMIVLANSGIKGEQAGTGLRGVLSSLQAPSRESAKVLKELGVEVKGLDGEMRPLSDIMLDLKDRGMTTEQAFRLFGREAASVALTLANEAGPSLQGLEAELRNADGSAKRMADTLLTGLAGATAEAENAIEAMQMELGEMLAGPLQRFLELGTQIVNEALLPAIKWFRELPEPIQQGALAFGAILAAVGPVVTAIGLLLTFPVSGTVIGWSAAIAGAGAALVTAYQAFEPFRNIVDHLWGIVRDLVTELWTLGGGIAAVVGEVMDGNGPLSQLVGLIARVVGQIAEWTAKLALLPLRGFADGLHAINELLGNHKNALEKAHPGLDKHRKAVEDNAKAQADAAMKAAGLVDEQGKYIASAQKAENQTRKLAVGFRGQKDATEEALQKLKGYDKAAKELSPELQALFSVMTDVTKELDRQQKAAVQWYKDFVHTSQGYDEAAKAAAELTKQVNATIAAQSNLATVSAPAVIEQLMKVEHATDDFYDALARLGIQSTETFATTRQEAEEAYRVIMASDRATQFQRDSALAKYYEAMKAESQALGTKIPEDLEKAMAEAKQRLDGPNGLSAQKSAWQNFGNEVSTIVTNMVQDLSKTLWDGDLSWGEKFKGMLRGIGEAFTSSMIQPMLNAITGPNGLIEKGFKALINSLGELDGLLGRIFGGAASAAGNAAKDAADLVSGNSPVSNAGGAVSGLAGGTMGIVGAIGSIGTMVSSVVSNFQLARQEGTLNKIEHNTRYAMMFLGEREDQGILGRLFAIELATVYTLKKIEEPGGMRDRLASADDRLGWILGKLEMGGGVLETLWAIKDRMDTSNGFLSASFEALAKIQEAAKAGMGHVYNITVNVTGADVDADDIATAVMNRIQEQHRMAY